jgi:glycine cleavage system regulatory protein
MTTEKEEVSASMENSAEEVASTVLAAQTEPAQAEEQVQEKVPEQAPVSGPTIADIENVFNKYQGTQNNWNASRMKQIEDNLQTKVDEALMPFRELTSKMEQAQIEQLEPEEQVEYWRGKAQATEAPQQQQQQQTELSAEEKLNLANGVTQLITNAGLQMTHLDSKIWEGATTDMTVEQFYTVAQNNIGRLKTAPASRPASPPPAPPPTTQEAPSQTTSPIETKSEAVDAFQRGDINIDEYRRIGTEKGWMRG